MNRGSKTYAPWALAVSGIALLVSFGLYVVQRAWNVNLQLSLAVFIIGLALFVYLDPDRARRLMTGRQARYGSNALVLIVAFLGILVVINYVIHQNAQNWSLRWDLTEDKERTLAEETLLTLEELPGPVIARAFFTTRVASSAERARELFDDYKFFAGGNFNYEFIDPESDPLAAQAASITRDGTVVFTLGEQQELVTLISEQEFTGALVRLMNPGEKVVYFLAGHGERSPDETGDEHLSQVRDNLETKNYIVKTLNLLAANAIPVDAAVLVVAGPQVPITQAEVELIEAYLANGGALVVLMEPVILTEFGEEQEPLTSYLALKWGIVLGNDLIIDLTSPQPAVAISAAYSDHVIVAKTQGIFTVFPNARSVKIAANAPANITPTILIQTADQSWAETDLEGLANNQEPVPDPETDFIGPVPLAVAAEDLTTSARVAVIGDVSFITSANIVIGANADLFSNTIDWSAEQEQIISLTPRSQTQRFLLPPQEYVIRLVQLGSIFVLPGLTLLAGIVSLIRRRRRG